MNLPSNILGSVAKMKAKLTIYIIAAIILIGATWWVFARWHELQDLRVDNKTLTTKLSDAQDNMQLCVNSNSINNDTINKLLAERAQAQAKVNDLSQKQSFVVDKLIKLQESLKSLEKDGNGPVAAYMRETIRGIQKAEDNEQD